MDLTPLHEGALSCLFCPFLLNRQCNYYRFHFMYIPSTKYVGETLNFGLARLCLLIQHVAWAKLPCLDKVLCMFKIVVN